MVERAHGLGRRVMVRHNVTVQFETGQDDLPEFFAAHAAEVVSSLPHYTQDATDRQRGHGVYEKSIAALLRLNAVGELWRGPHVRERPSAATGSRSRAVGVEVPAQVDPIPRGWSISSGI